MKELRPYQEAALQAIKDDVGAGKRRLVCQAPTGSGKTLLAAAIVDGCLSKDNRIAFVVPSINLIDQTVEMFYHQGIRDIGVIQANHGMTDWSRPVQVASIQTIRSKGRYPPASVVIVDECHQLHAAHIQWMGRLEHKDGAGPIVGAAEGWEKIPFIGLSATPWTTGLGRYFEVLHEMETTQGLIDQGYLSKFKVFGVDHPDLSQIRDVAGDYHEGQLSTVMREERLVANIVETWRQRHNKDKTFLFAVDCAHAQMLRDRFVDAGITCGYQDASTSLADRAELKRAFHNGEVRVLANVGTLTVGVDYDVRCLVLARPTKSEMLYVQIVGRALRTADGKDFALILDHTDTTARLGMVTDIHHDHLSVGRMDSNKRKPAGAPLPKPCPKCAYLIPVGLKICPECGFERKIESKIVEREGQLVEYESTYSRKKAEPTFFQYSYEEKAKWYAQLRWYGTAKNYNPKWAAIKFKEKFQHWPPFDWNRHHPMEPGPEVMNYIRAGLIAWAKSPRNPYYRARSL